MEQTSQPTNVGSNDGLGLVPKRTALGATSESDAYQEWLSENGESTALGVATFGWLAWSAAVEHCRDAMASKLIDVWIASNGQRISWGRAVNIIAILKGLPDAERDRLLALDDEAQR